MFQQMSHHLLIMLQRHINERYADKGYTIKTQAELELPVSGGKKALKADFAVFGPDSDEIPVLVADVDTQSCGPQKNFTDVIAAYSEALVPEYWIFYTKDHLIIVRRQEENGFGKHKVYSESDLLVPEGLFPMFREKHYS